MGLPTGRHPLIVTIEAEDIVNAPDA